MATARQARSTDKGMSGTGATVAIAAGAAAAGALFANLLRKSAVQAPTVMAGNWDQALAAEHKATLAIFDLLEKTSDDQTGRRNVLFTQMKHALSKHAFQEENAIYTMMRDHGLKEAADHLNDDHGYVKQYLFDLSEMKKDDAGWLPKVREFRTLIEKHVREEEDELFPQMRDKLTPEQNKHVTAVMNREGFKLA